MTLKLTHKEIAKKLVLKMISFDYGSDDVPSLITELEQAFTQVANEALEEAARRCEDNVTKDMPDENRRAWEIATASVRNAAKAIRALKKSQVKL